MRIILLALITIIGANVFISVMNSKTLDNIQERNAALEALMNPPSSSIK
jgi:hypothetical protein|tara:strand:- start:760 stop:906 length:147 start_codon:yes stop_codon:yes gene_type:complete